MSNHGAARANTADTFFADLQSVALAIESRDFNTTEDNFVHTAKCIQYTKKRQLVTRSGLKMTTVLSMPCPPRAGNEGTSLCSTVFQTELQQVQHFKVDVFAGDANAAAHRYYKR